MPYATTVRTTRYLTRPFRGNRRSTPDQVYFTRYIFIRTFHIIAIFPTAVPLGKSWIRSVEREIVPSWGVGAGTTNAEPWPYPK